MGAATFKKKIGANILNLYLSNAQYLWVIAMGEDEKVINLDGVYNS